MQEIDVESFIEDYYCLTYKELSQRYHISESTVSNKVRELKAKGHIDPDRKLFKNKKIGWSNDSLPEDIRKEISNDIMQMPIDSAL